MKARGSTAQQSAGIFGSGRGEQERAPISSSRVKRHNFSNRTEEPEASSTHLGASGAHMEAKGIGPLLSTTMGY